MSEPEKIDVLTSTLEEQFDFMIRVSYPGKELSDNQHNALKIAFFAGAKVANAQAIMGGSGHLMLTMLEIEEFTAKATAARAAGNLGKL